MRNRVIGVRAAVLSLALAIVSSSAFATPLTYTDRLVWQAAATGVVDHDFSEFTGGATFLGSSYAFGGVTYDGGPTTSLYGVGSLGFQAAYLTSSYLEWQAPVPTTTDASVLTVTFASAQTAVGFDYGTLFGLSEPFTVEIAGGPTYLLSSAANAYAFFGFTTDSPFTSLTITDATPHSFPPGTGGFPLIDNLSNGQALEEQVLPVPEPASLMLLGGGLVVCAVRGLRKRAR